MGSNIYIVLGASLRNFEKYEYSNGFHDYSSCVFIFPAITLSVVERGPETPATVDKIPSLGSLKMDMKFSSLEVVYEIIV